MQGIELNRQKYIDCLSINSEIGFVDRVIPPVVYAKGLPGAGIWEVVYFENGISGVITALAEGYVEIMLFNKNEVAVGMRVSRSGEIMQVGVGDSLLGKLISPLGVVLGDGVSVLGLTEKRYIDINPVGIDRRARVVAPLETGVTMVDFLVPLGKGQRELVIGDRNIGKTAFVLQSILTQVKKGSVCIYAGIGKKQRDIRKVEEFLNKHNIMNNSVIVSSFASETIGDIYITPYVAMTIAEYFRDKGHDSLLILDDLTDHARYYRELSLLSRKFPGRDAYPGDVFYTHARLLERAGNFKINDSKTVSITCLVVSETVEGDISGYIQTNLMSITDGHIFFDQELYKKGKRPAINNFLSVTRVGRQTQSTVRWGINRELSSFLILHSKAERFIHFGAELNEGIKSTLLMGERLGFFFDQEMEEVLDINVQIVTFCLIWAGVLRDVTEGKIKYYVNQCQKKYQESDDFKKKLDGLVESCTDFNQLLGKVSAQNKEIVDLLETGK
jgi:F-type H+-transporting ATPase subunit alpha